MMSIADQFGKKKNGRRDEPEVPMPRVVETPKAPHAAHAEALTYVNDMIGTIDFLREENSKLRQDGALALMRIKDLEHEAVARDRNLEMYRRYSIEVRTHLEHIQDVCHRAHEAAVEAGESAPPPMPDAALATVVDAIAADLKGEAPAAPPP